MGFECNLESYIFLLSFYSFCTVHYFATNIINCFDFVQKHGFYEIEIDFNHALFNLVDYCYFIECIYCVF